MKILAKTALVLTVFSLLSLQAIAGDVLDQVSYATVTPPAVQPPVVADKDLARKYSDFQDFGPEDFQLSKEYPTVSSYLRHQKFYVKWLWDTQDNLLFVFWS